MSKRGSRRPSAVAQRRQAAKAAGTPRLSADQLARMQALAADVDLASVGTHDLVRVVQSERAGFVEELATAKAKATTTPLTDDKVRAELLRPVVERAGRLGRLQDELEGRPGLRLATVSSRPVEQPKPTPEPAPVRGDWESVFPKLPDLRDVPHEELKALYDRHVDVYARIGNGELGRDLTPEQREGEIRVGQWETRRLRSWLTGQGRLADDRQQRGLSRRLRDLAVAAGLGKPVGLDGIEQFTKEETEMIEQLRRRRNRKPDPRTASVAAAVTHWLTSEGWDTHVAGTQETQPAFDMRDLGVLPVALRLIGDADGGEVVWEETAGFYGGNRIHVDGGGRNVLAHLADNGFLTHRVEGNKSRIGYGSLTLRIAKAAGVTVAMPAAG